MTTKSIFLFSILFCFMALPVHAELSDADLDKIRLIVKDEVKSEITASEARMKEYISQEIKTVNVKISETDKRLSQIFWVVIALIGLIGAAIGVPQWLNRKDRGQSDETFTREEARVLIKGLLQEFTPEQKKLIEELMHAQEEKIEKLTQEIETLKQQRAVNP